MTSKLYTLPSLSYGYSDLEPYISQEQLTIHHQKHHMAYINAANASLEKIEKARKEGLDFDQKATLKDLSFNIGGHRLHSLFWENLAPKNSGGGGEPKGKLAEAVNYEFGSFERFKKEFSQAALATEGSGWACLVLGEELNRLMIGQIEKHNANVYLASKILMVLDVFEHAYYLDYKNERAKYIEAFWNIINWEVVEKRLSVNHKITI